MNAKQDQAKLAKLLPKHHPALKSQTVNDLHGEAILAWYGEHGMIDEMTTVGKSLSAPAARSFATFLHNVAAYSKAKMEALVPTDPKLAGEYALLYMLTAPDDDHLSWITLSAKDFLRVGLTHYSDLMRGFETVHQSRSERSAALRYLTMLGDGAAE